MPYALVQKEITPDVEQLKRAFKALKRLTEADAVKLAKDCCGILAKRLSQADAALLQQQFEAQGVPTEIVPTATLPVLPEAKFVRRMEFQPEALLIYDPLGRAVPVPWAHLALISAGVVKHFDLTTTRHEERVNRYDPIRGHRTEVVTELRHRVENEAKLLLQILLTRGAMSFEIEADTFLFKFCLDRPELDVGRKLALLIQMLAEKAPHAVLNRGATALKEGALQNATYPSKAALRDESAWLLWRMNAAA